MNKDQIYQIQLPGPEDHDPHPRLTVNGYGIHAGETFTALFPDGWHEISLEIRWDQTGPACWYITAESYRDICPIGLFVKM